MSSGILVIGIGNEFRSDDGLGLYAARELKRRGFPGVTVIEHPGEGTSLLESWKASDSALLIDAVSSGGTPGDIHRIDCLVERVPHSLFRSSSHTFGVSEAIALGTNLGSLPRVLMLYGLEGNHFGPGSGLSDAVLRGMPGLIACIEDDIAHLTHLMEPAGEHP
jgi:hydrogenase maturation protease